MNSNAMPDIDPANNDSLAGTLRFNFFKMMQSVNGMLPARVIKYDRTANRVQVQLLIAMVTTSGAQIPRPQIASIPVMVFGGGDCFLSFNINSGDLGWVLANDRDISLFLQTYNETAPNSARMQNFADGVFIPDIMRQYTIDSEDDANVVLSTTDSLSRIAVGASGVKITAPTVTIAGVLDGLNGANLSGTIDLTGLGVYPFIITPA